MIPELCCKYTRSGFFKIRTKKLEPISQVGMKVFAWSRSTHSTILMHSRSMYHKAVCVNIEHSLYLHTQTLSSKSPLLQNCLLSAIQIVLPLQPLLLLAFIL